MRDAFRAIDVLNSEEIKQFTIFLELRALFKTIEKESEIDLSDLLDVVNSNMRNLEKEIGKRILDWFWEEGYIPMDLSKFIEKS